MKKDSWTEEEDRVLIEAHKEIGNKWAEIAKRLPGRTENSLKNHWNTTKRRQFAHRCTRTTKNSQGATNNNILQDYIKSLSITINHNNMPPPLPPPSAVPAPTPAMHVSVMPPENENILKPAKIEKVDVEVEDVMLPSYDSFADMYSLLFDGGSVFDVTDNIVFGKIDEFMMELEWNDDQLVSYDNGTVVMPSNNEVAVKKEIYLMEIISQSRCASNSVGFS